MLVGRFTSLVHVCPEKSFGQFLLLTVFTKRIFSRLYADSSRVSKELQLKQTFAIPQIKENVGNKQKVAV